MALSASDQTPLTVEQADDSLATDKRASIRTRDLTISLFNQDINHRQSVQQLRERQLFDNLGLSSHKIFNNRMSGLLARVAQQPGIEREFYANAFMGQLDTVMPLSLAAIQHSSRERASNLLDNIELEILKGMLYSHETGGVSMHPDDIGHSSRLQNIDRQLRQEKRVLRPQSIESLSRIGGTELGLLRLRLQLSQVEGVVPQLRRLAGDFSDIITKQGDPAPSSNLTIYRDQLLEYLAELELVAIIVGDAGTVKILRPAYDLIKKNCVADHGEDMGQWRTDTLHQWVFLESLYNSKSADRQRMLAGVVRNLLDSPSDFRNMSKAYSSYRTNYFPGLSQVLVGAPAIRFGATATEPEQAEIRQIFSWVNTCKYLQEHEERHAIQCAKRVALPASAALTDPLADAFAQHEYANILEAIFSEKWQEPSLSEQELLQVSEVRQDFSWSDMIQLQGMLAAIPLGNIQEGQFGQKMLLDWLDLMMLADNIQEEVIVSSTGVQGDIDNRRSASLWAAIMPRTLQRPPVTANELPRADQDGVLLLSFFRFPNPYPYAPSEPKFCGYYCVSYDSMHEKFGMVRIGSEADVESWVNKITSGTSSIHENSSQEKFWPHDPITTAITSLFSDATVRHRVQVMPDANLWRVPWASLAIGDNGFLIERCEVSVDSFWIRKQMPSKADLKHAVFVGACDYDLPLSEVIAKEVAVFGHELSPRIRVELPMSLPIPKAESLEFSVAEQRTFQEVFSGNDCVIQELTGADAIEAQVWQLRSPELLFFSTHGFFISSEVLSSEAIDRYSAGLLGDDFDRCGLLLSGVNQFPSFPRGCDGILTGREVSMMDLSGTRCVVLSACDTTLGDSKVGFSVRGLRRAFEIAGAQSVVSTLWQVDDHYTAELMKAFLERYKMSGDAAASLRDAQISQIAKLRETYGYAPPYLWSGFISSK